MIAGITTITTTITTITATKGRQMHIVNMLTIAIILNILQMPYATKLQTMQPLITTTKTIEAITTKTTYYATTHKTTTIPQLQAQITQTQQQQTWSKFKENIELAYFNATTSQSNYKNTSNRQQQNASNNNNNTAAILEKNNTVVITHTRNALQSTDEMQMTFHQYCLAHRNSLADIFTIILYTLVCVIGLFGNTLVIYVVLRFSKMQTVTNIYILNLAIADECFLIGIPFLLYTMRICSWKFGEYMCKAYMVSTSITQFTSSIFLLIMSADRYMAVCHPISSPKYRTLHIAKLVSVLAWLISAVLMLPVILYASTVSQEDGENLSCNIEWPESYKKHSGTTFILYTLFLGFAAPLCFILGFYYLVIRKLHAVGTKHKSKEKKRSHRKVTRLVLTVITVYIFCWLPHWISQVALINSNPAQRDLSRLEVLVFLLLGCLVYSNSAMNPILYAFLSDNFRKSFFKAFTCMTKNEVNAQLNMEPSYFTKQGSRRRVGSKRNVEHPPSMQKTKPGNLIGNSNSSTTTSSTTTAEKACAGTTTAGNLKQPNGRLSDVAIADDCILMLEQEHTVCAIIDEAKQSVHVLQTDL